MNKKLTLILILVILTAALLCACSAQRAQQWSCGPDGTAAPAAARASADDGCPDNFAEQASADAAASDSSDAQTSSDADSGAAAQGALPDYLQSGCIYIETGTAPGEGYQPALVTVDCADSGVSAETDSMIQADSGTRAGAEAGSTAAQTVRDRNSAAADYGLCDAAAEIKLRGNSTKESDKKAYTLKFEADQSLLGMDEGRKWALVSNPFDKSLLRPAVGFTYGAALGLDYVSETRLCRVWVNGVYMGVYTAMEPVEAGEGRVEIDPDGGDFLLERNLGRYEDDVVYIDSEAGLRFEFNEPEEPDEAQVQQCAALLRQAEGAILTSNHTEYEKYIDVESFVNFYIFHEMIKDVDFGEYSTRYYFKDGIMYAGPPWDLDLTMGNVSTEKPEFKYASYNNVDGAGDESGDSSRGMWAASGDYYYWLCKDSWFRTRVQQRWLAVRAVTENLTAENELGNSLIDSYLTAHGEALESNFSEAGRSADGQAGDTCWIIDQPAHMSAWQEPADTYADNVEMLRTWLQKRAAYLDQQFGTGRFKTPAQMSDWSAPWN